MSCRPSAIFHSPFNLICCYGQLLHVLRQHIEGVPLFLLAYLHCSAFLLHIHGVRLQFTLLLRKLILRYLSTLSNASNSFSYISVFSAFFCNLFNPLQSILLSFTSQLLEIVSRQDVSSYSQSCIVHLLFENSSDKRIETEQHDLKVNNQIDFKVLFYCLSSS